MGAKDNENFVRGALIEKHYIAGQWARKVGIVMMDWCADSGGLRDFMSEIAFHEKAGRSQGNSRFILFD